MLKPLPPPGFGIEEECLLVDLRTRNVPTQAPPGLLAACSSALGTCLAEEMFECQLELVTPILHDFTEARACLLDQRARLAQAVAGFGMGLVSAGSHPFADGLTTRSNPSPRYECLFDDYRMIARSSLLCGLHVHVGIPAGHDRVRLVRQLLHWLPLLLALSASSPFWLGHATGCMSYRRVICGQWPRMELPDDFASEAEYREHVRWLLSSASIRNDNDIWWFIRPSARFPTLELRIADACPRLADSLCIAGLFRSMVTHALAHLELPSVTAIQRQVVTENYWRARLQGIHGRYLDETGCHAMDTSTWLTLAEERFGATARALGEEGAFAQAHQILQSGSSADRQLDAYQHALAQGSSKPRALITVVDGLLAEFTEGWPTERKIT
ncbi:MULTISPECIES: carboxylate-amine ligase [unclassified Pseudomonas]|uniref:carboxylate-amine ligase n=2 Tax=Pseudomonas TaxID=286 RepID=UPI00129D4751|nr:MULTISPECIES: carboxylate-amine ligase [unclassified Pseudomonas]MDH4653625.1 carboxylate-amine ligase [Pseudomonas sp. BN606]MRK22028.1 carboxylate-amine ligase [Pseudomonas sp. JG-B]